MDVNQLQQEISDLKKEALELSLSNEALTDFIENAALPLHWVDENGIIIWANQAELTALGYNSSEYVGQSITKFHADAEVIDDILTRLTNNETLHNYKARLRCKDGSIKHVLISSNVFRKDNKFVHTRCFTRDVTPMVLEEQRKDDFVALVSHELKTPLTTILSYVQVLLSKAKKSEDALGTLMLTRTEMQAKRMTTMINDFLHVARQETPNAHLHTETFAFTTLVQDVIQDVQLMYHSHNIEFEHCGDVELHADRAKIGQVLSNLLTNAIKYSPEGSTVAIGCERQSENLKIYVRDQGVGISAADQKRLFDRFYRVENARSKNVSGFGIGLYLVTEILKYHNTTIHVESIEGEGSTFYFTMPIHTS
ncbi:MAG: ATP-binding protein [Bacteroidota bacterium]